MFPYTMNIKIDKSPLKIDLNNKFNKIKLSMTLKMKKLKNLLNINKTLPKINNNYLIYKNNYYLLVHKKHPPKKKLKISIQPQLKSKKPFKTYKIAKVQ